jgi:hypothetical protein
MTCSSAAASRARRRRRRRRRAQPEWRLEALVRVYEDEAADLLAGRGARGIDECLVLWHRARADGGEDDRLQAGTGGSGAWPTSPTLPKRAFPTWRVRTRIGQGRSRQEHMPRLRRATG